MAGPDVLRRLANDPVYAVRRAVAVNPKTEIAVVAQLRVDPMRAVRRAARDAVQSLIRVAEMPLHRVDRYDALAVCERFADYIGVTERQIATTLLFDRFREASTLGREKENVFHLVDIACDIVGEERHSFGSGSSRQYGHEILLLKGHLVALASARASAGQRTPVATFGW
jgi:hypothetical protein